MSYQFRTVLYGRNRKKDEWTMIGHAESHTAMPEFYPTPTRPNWKYYKEERAQVETIEWGG